ncbi:MAG: zinc-dependent alcohol dehydrogenase family protein [Chloroflexia bacterium]|nr:zinc-dependent alcohol dehydrogenase family protein [Chloroflexia bacterium]
MKAVMVDEPGAVRVLDIPKPEPGPDDVVIRVGACGICGTDIHIIDGEFPPTVYPIVIGHEFGGDVVAVGADVESFQVGDRVGVDPTLNCGACYFCQRGMGNLCERWNAVGVGHHPGGFAEYVSVPAHVVYPIPAKLSMKAAALIEPVSCVVRGFHRLQPQTGETYLTYGAGPMGLLNAQVARYNGASLVALIDINPSRLDRARNEFGFENVATRLEDLEEIAPRGFDNVIEATGVTKVAEMAIDAVKRRGKLLLFGVCPPGEKASYDAFKIYNEEISILGTMAVLNSYGPAIDIIASGAIDVDRMVTDTYTLDEFPAALQHVRSGTGLKIQVAETSK